MEKNNIIIHENDRIEGTLNVWCCSTGWNMEEFNTIISAMPVELPMTILDRTTDGCLWCHDKNKKTFILSFGLFFHLSYSTISIDYEDEVWTYTVENKDGIIDCPKIKFKSRESKSK